MAFRKYGGINYSASNNIVRNHYTNSDNLTSSNRIGLSSNIIESETQSNSNLVFESNINMSGNTIFNNSISSKNVSGIYLLNQINSSSQYVFYPIYSSMVDYNNYYSNNIDLPKNDSLHGNNHLKGIYNNVSIRIANIDHAYLITPNYGLKVYNDINHTGDVILDVYNHTFFPVIVSPSVILSGKSCILYFG